MSDRHKGYVVTLDASLRDDDSKLVMDAIRMIKGVVSIDPVIDHPGAEIDRQVVRLEFYRKIMDVIFPGTKI
jgi:hypothetical protein